MKNFEIATGTIIGKDHVQTATNNQDAISVVECVDRGVVVGVLCDGCSSSPHSEVGAKVGAKIIAKNLLNLSSKMDVFRLLMDQGKYPEILTKQYDAILEDVRVQTIEVIDALIRVMGDSPRDDGKCSIGQTISDYFMFTVLGFCIHPKYFFTFACGDGYLHVNNDRSLMTSGPKNEPDYLVYALLEDTAPKFKIIHQGLTENLNKLLIGSDGVFDIVAHAEKNVPGQSNKIGSVTQFWNDEYFKNPFNVGRRLTLLQRSLPIYNKQGLVESIDHGVLVDDTSLIAVRRKS